MCRLIPIVRQLNIKLQLRIPVFAIQFSADEEVRDMNGRGRIQVHVAENAAEPPEILILQPTGITPAVYFDRKLVLAVSQIRREVEFRRGEGVLAIADKLPVHPDVEGGLHALEADEYGTALPVVWNTERTDVGADRIVAGWRIRGL
ncbi:hypothetical protein D3C71_1768720 [compost metagenome]